TALADTDLLVRRDSLRSLRHRLVHQLRGRARLLDLHLGDPDAVLLQDALDLLVVDRQLDVAPGTLLQDGVVADPDLVVRPDQRRQGRRLLLQPVHLLLERGEDGRVVDHDATAGGNRLVGYGGQILV